MELRQLEYFAAVAEEASFTRAAARLHVAQPGVSAQIRRLEAELGHELLDRTPRGVRVTAVGAAVLPHAHAALRAVADVRETIDAIAGLLRGRVRVGMITTSTEPGLPGALASFHQRHPGVTMALTEGESDGLLRAVAEGDLDLALVGIAGAPPSGIATQLVSDEPLVAAAGPQDPLARRKRISLAELAERDLMCLPAGTGTRTALDAGCAAAGVRPRIAFVASDPRTLVQLAALGLGVAVIPESLAPAGGPVVPIAVERPRMRSRLELAWRADGPASPAARALTDHVRAVYATL